MRVEDVATKRTLDAMVKGHNQAEDQVWSRTLKTSRHKGNIEVIGICNYGNAYLCQFAPDGRARIDWIKKSDVGEKYSNVLPEHYRVSDEVLNKYRELL